MSQALETLPHSPVAFDSKEKVVPTCRPERSRTVAWCTGMNDEHSRLGLSSYDDGGQNGGSCRGSIAGARRIKRDVR